MKKIFGAALAAAMALTLAACGGSSETPAASSSSAAAATGSDQPADEQVLNLVYTDLSLLDVNDARNANEMQVLTEVQEGLFRTFTDENGVDQTENAGCTSYEISDDNLTYTFHLREDAKWSDGQPVTAQNYVDSWIRLLTADNAFPYYFLASGIAGAEEYYEGTGSADDVQVSAPDDYTLVAVLAAPDPSFIKIGRAHV